MYTHILCVYTYAYMIYSILGRSVFYVMCILITEIYVYHCRFPCLFIDRKLL